MLKLDNINIIYIAFVFIWQAIRINILKDLDGAGRIGVTASLLIIFINLIYNPNFIKTIKSNRSVKIWFFWFIYATTNTFFLYDESVKDLPMYIFINKYILIPFVIISIAGSINFKNSKYFLKIMEIVLFLSIILFFLGSDLSAGRYLNELFNINELMLYIIALIATILINSIVINRSILKVILLMIFPTFFVIMAGSRMGFGAYVILIFGFLIVKNRKNSILYFFQILSIGVFSFLAFNFLIESTTLGERLMSTTTQTETKIDNPAQGTIFEFFGDRGVYYIYGWFTFLEHPFFGIGLLNYSKGNAHVLHVEYLIHLAELGIVGFIMYMLFLYSLLKNIIDNYKKEFDKDKYFFLFFILLTILFCATVLFLYNSLAIAYLFGLIILISKQNKKIILIQTK